MIIKTMKVGGKKRRLSDDDDHDDDEDEIDRRKKRKHLIQDDFFGKNISDFDASFVKKKVRGKVVSHFASSSSYSNSESDEESGPENSSIEKEERRSSKYEDDDIKGNKEKSWVSPRINKSDRKKKSFVSDDDDKDNNEEDKDSIHDSFSSSNLSLKKSTGSRIRARGEKVARKDTMKSSQEDDDGDEDDNNPEKLASSSFSEDDEDSPLSQLNKKSKTASRRRENKKKVEVRKSDEDEDESSLSKRKKKTEKKYSDFRLKRKKNRQVDEAASSSSFSDETPLSKLQGAGARNDAGDQDADSSGVSDISLVDADENTRIEIGKKSTKVTVRSVEAKKSSPQFGDDKKEKKKRNKKEKIRDTKLSSQSNKENANVKSKVSSSKSVSGKVAGLARLKKCLWILGKRLNYVRLFDGVDKIEDQKKKLKSLLLDLGVEGRPSIEGCKRLKVKRDTEAEVAALDLGNIIDAGKRSRRGAEGVERKRGGGGEKTNSANRDDDDYENEEVEGKRISRLNPLIFDDEDSD